MQIYNIFKNNNNKLYKHSFGNIFQNHDSTCSIHSNDHKYICITCILLTFIWVKVKSESLKIIRNRPLESPEIVLIE